MADRGRCPDVAVQAFSNTMGRQIWIGNALLLASAGVIGILVGIGGYGRRYRHHPFTRFIFLGVNTLFLPIISYVVSTLGDNSNDYVNEEGGTTLAALCQSTLHPCMVITWAFLVQIAAINTTSVVAVDSREGRKAGPPLELVVKGVWTFYLGASITKKRFVREFLRFRPRENSTWPTLICAKIMFAPFALICAKIWLKCYAFRKAQQSFGLGRNPSLTFGYMQQLQQQEEGSQHGEPMVGEDAPPPPLLVMGEDSVRVKKQPRGYVFNNDIGITAIENCLVTLDRVWQLNSMLPTSTPRLKDLCFSFALFKLLRCRFARYQLINVGSMGTLKFFWSLLLKDGEHDRVFKLIADELSFVHDYYYSSLPISYTECWLPILSIFISVLSIGYCILAAYFFGVFAAHLSKQDSIQIHCEFWCNNLPVVSKSSRPKDFGSLYFDVVPVFLLLVLVLVSEVRDMASYICSNWTKVALVCHYVNRAPLRHPLRMDRWVGLLLQCRCKIIEHWDEKMGQCSVLVLHPRITLPGRLVRRLLRLPDQKSKAKLPAAVKVCIMDAVRSSSNTGRKLSNGTTSLHRSQVGQNFLWACSSKGTSDIILTWHIATCILEVRHPYRHDQERRSSLVSSSNHKIAAIHLSRYCAYLMTWSPELLPDDHAWSKSLYEAVKKDAERVLAAYAAAGSSTPEAEYQQLVELLGSDAKHEVLKNGVRLGKQLVELIEGEETAWTLLAGFWSEMILYVAPSNNLKGHKEAIAQGGELITLLWALVFHAGMVNRPGDEGSGATAAGAV